MESWREVLRKGFLPLMPTSGLLAAQKALASDDPRLIQGVTTIPTPMPCVQDWPVEKADFFGFVYWQSGETNGSVGEVEEAFARACFDADQILGEPAACRYALNHWDDAENRYALFSEMLDEVNLELASRAEPEDEDDDVDEQESDFGCPVAMEVK